MLHQPAQILILAHPKACSRACRLRRYPTAPFALVLVLAAAPAARCAEPAQQGAAAGALTTVVVTATRIAQDTQDLPVSVDRIDGATLHAGQSQVNLSESLDTVPGVSVQSRQNYAQDLQISSRGFGARSEPRLFIR